MKEMWNKVFYFFGGLGAANWVFDKAFKWNIVEKLFASMPTLITVVYWVIGISGVVILLKLFKVMK